LSIEPTFLIFLGIFAFIKIILSLIMNFSNEIAAFIISLDRRIFREFFLNIFYPFLHYFFVVLLERNDISSC